MYTPRRKYRRLGRKSIISMMVVYLYCNWYLMRCTFLCRFALALHSGDNSNPSTNYSRLQKHGIYDTKIHHSLLSASHFHQFKIEYIINKLIVAKGEFLFSMFRWNHLPVMTKVVRLRNNQRILIPIRLQ